jgi:hypothetical protein
MTYLEARVPERIEQPPQRRLADVRTWAREEQQIDVRVWGEVAAAVTAYGDDRKRRGGAERVPGEM